MYDYLIVGAGLYGSVCANELTKKGYKVLIVDKRNHIGGNIYTKKENNIDVHVYGAHIFHTSNERVWTYVNQFAKFNDYINSPIANYKGEMYNLPFNMNTFHQLWGVKTAKEAKQKIEDDKANYKIINPRNLEEQAISLVGPTIYEKLIKGYTEKQWGDTCDNLPAFIIKRLPLRFEFNNNYFNDVYQGIPLEGYTAIVDKLLSGSDVRLNCNFIDNKNELMNLAKNIIFTGQIDEFFDYKFGELQYRSLRFEVETLNQKDYQGNAVINYTDRETPYTRIIEHKHFLFEDKSEKTIITREYSKKWEKGEEPYYPINNEYNNALYLKYFEESKKLNNVFFGGRLGLYQYLNMDQIILKALEFCDQIKAK